MAYTNLVPVIGTIFRMQRTNDCCSHLMAMQTGGGIVNFVVSPDTLVMDCRRLQPGMRVAAFYDSTLPMPLIYPPQYRAAIVAVLKRNEEVMLDFFDRNLISASQSLQLNLSGNTQVETLNGQSYGCTPVNQLLLVYYTNTTRSIPPQTTPRKVVVFCED